MVTLESIDAGRPLLALLHWRETPGGDVYEAALRESRRAPAALAPAERWRAASEEGLLVLLTQILASTELLAVAVFAMSGALAAAVHRQDILGFILFGTITGVGGGTLRDLLLQAGPVFWIDDTRYLWVCISASLFVWFLAPLLASNARALVWADAAGLALFSVIGTAKALRAEAPAVVAVVMGVMTVSFGSLMRDTLLNRDPVMLEEEIYVSAALLGGLSYVVLVGILGEGSTVAPSLAMAAAFALRSAAIVYDLRLPKYGRSG